MDLQQEPDSEGILHAENIGGIQETTVSFSPGVTILEGRNATNRTSFLQAVMAALGSDNGTIKGDADEATVELTLGDDTYTRHLRRRSNSIVADGTPYLDDCELPDLFAFLIESNEARRSVATNGDLRELIMQPIDIEAIQAEIDQLTTERNSLETELEEIDDLKGDLPALEEKQARLHDQIDEKQVELEAKEEELAAADANVEETREEKSELDDKMEVLRAKRSELEDIRYDLETERESHGALKQEEQALVAEEDDLLEAPMGELDELESEISKLREQKQQLETEVNELQSVIGFNEERLEDTDASTFETPTDDSPDEPTDQLLEDDEVTCWTCGSTVKHEQIEATVTQLRDLSQSKMNEVHDLDDTIDKLQAEQQDLQQSQRERDRIDRRLTGLEDEIESSEDQIEHLQAQRTELTEDIESIEADIEELENEDYSAVMDLHKEANQLEYDLGRLENDLEDTQTDITEIESRIDERSDVAARIEEVTAKIEDLRTKIEGIEEESIEQFNEQMETVLEMLDYSNLDRIWIERVEKEIREGRRKVTKSLFELHVIRTAESGAAYEDTVDHLSESEREVTGLIFALAGYLAHEVYDDIPFILLDSLEAIDSDRIAALIEYLNGYTNYLLVALLPEDAGTLPDHYESVTEI
jgi:DNA repair exonuclease SbcCD ATPase subunit